MGNQTGMASDGTTPIYYAPDIIFTNSANEFVKNYVRNGGLPSYFSVLKYCKISKSKKLKNDKIAYNQLTQDQLRTRIRLKLNSICSMFL